MNELWGQYILAEKKCLKSQWKKFLDEFITAYFRASKEECSAWLAQNLKLIAEHKVPLRHPLFEKIIFPHLFDGYQKQDLACIKQLIHLDHHIYSPVGLLPYRNDQFRINENLLTSKGYKVPTPNEAITSIVILNLGPYRKWVTHTTTTEKHDVWRVLFGAAASSGVSVNRSLDSFGGVAGVADVL